IVKHSPRRVPSEGSYSSGGSLPPAIRGKPLWQDRPTTAGGLSPLCQGRKPPGLGIRLFYGRTALYVDNIVKGNGPRGSANRAADEITISKRNSSGLSACRWLRAPAPTEIDRPDQPQAVEHFSPPSPRWRRMTPSSAVPINCPASTDIGPQSG